MNACIRPEVLKSFAMVLNEYEAYEQGEDESNNAKRTLIVNPIGKIPSTIGRAPIKAKQTHH